MKSEKIKYASEARVNKIIETFKDQKAKYNIEILPTTKIQGLSGTNAYICEEVLAEMKNMGLVEVVEVKGKKKYWKLK